MEERPTMSIEEAEAFVANAPWREVQWRRSDSQMDQHWYLIVGDTIDPTTYWAMTRLIREKGYRGEYTARYRPGVELTNSYLEIGEFVYWAIPPKQLCRTRIEFGQHTRLPEQMELSDYRIEKL